MNDSFIKSGYRFLTPSHDKTSWNKIDSNGKLEPSGFKNLTPYGNVNEFEIEHIHNDQYRFDSSYFEKTFSFIIPNIQRTIIEDMCKNNQPVYILLLKDKNPNKPTIGYYVYPIDKIKPNQKTIDKLDHNSSSSIITVPQELSPNNGELQPTIEIETQNINQLPETNSINSQQRIITIEENLRINVENKKTKANNNFAERPPFKSIFTLKNGICFVVFGAIIYLIYLGKMNQFIKFQSI